MIVEVTVPEVGESITEGLLAEWVRKSGDLVQVDEPLFELETDKVNMVVEAQATGRLSTKVEAGATVEVGQIVGEIDTDAKGDAEKKAPAEAATAEAAAAKSDAPTLSPAVRRAVAEHHLDPATIPGTGKHGRVTKEDVLRQAEAQKKPAAPKQDVVPQKREEAAPEERQTRSPMTPLRKRLAQRLLEVQQNAAILTTFNEADMSRVIELRKQYRPEFKERHAVDLGFMSFFVKASVEALQAVPRANSFIDGDELVQNHYYDIGVAVSSAAGLVVPVVRDADQLSMAGIEASIADLAARAQDRRLTLEELTGGVFTISNGGIFGSMMSTPILNPPQSAILGMHAIKKRPVVVDDELVIRPMMYLAVSYDHRVLDGREAVTFLKRIVECIENPERILLAV